MNLRLHTLQRRIQSFVYAVQGVKHVLKGERNALLHCVSTMMVVIAGLVLEISAIEWLAVVLSIASVWTAEIFNTCIEKIMNYLTVRREVPVGIIKDIAAAAVLVTSIGAFVIGLIIFIPKILAHI